MATVLGGYRLDADVHSGASWEAGHQWYYPRIYWGRYSGGELLAHTNATYNSFDALLDDLVALAEWVAQRVREGEVRAAEGFQVDVRSSGGGVGFSAGHRFEADDLNGFVDALESYVGWLESAYAALKVGSKQPPAPRGAKRV